MIEDARVLQEEFIPSEVEHRHEEVSRVSGALEPCIHGEPADHSILFGPTGTGKTCIARYVVTQLREVVPDLDHEYVNCWQNYNRYRVLYRLLEGLDRAADVHRQSTPKDELLERLQAGPDGPYVVVLDEVDQLQDTKVLYDLHTIPGLAMILIANRETQFFHHVDDRVASRLRGSVRVRFDTYSVDELVSILEARVRWGLAPDVISTDQLELIGDAAAGDARVAISVLRTAARLAEQDHLDEITTPVIRTAIPEGREEVDRRTVENLNEHQRILYDVIREREAVDPDELYDAYEERASDPMTARTLRKYLAKMDQYDLIEAVGEGRARVYRVGG